MVGGKEDQVRGREKEGGEGKRRRVEKGEWEIKVVERKSEGQEWSRSGVGITQGYVDEGRHAALT